MPQEPEFRIGDLQAGPSDPAVPPGGGRVDANLFPAVAAWLALPSPERRERMDALAARARQEARPEVQAAWQAALRLLSEIQLNDDGGRR
jgi:hypothetical protein